MAAVLLLSSIAISVALAEVVLRLVAPTPPSWLPIYRRHPELPFPSAMPELRATVDTGETHWVVVTDAEGFRVGDAGHSEADCTALWLGDSFAFGHGVNYEQSLVGMVGAAAPRVRQINTAIPGYGPVQYRQILENLLAHGRRFEYVYVVTYVGNDFHDCVWDKNAEVHEGVIGHQADLKSFLKIHSQLYRRLSAALHRLAPFTATKSSSIETELADPNAWNQDFLRSARATYDKEMLRVQELALEHGATVRFVIIPTRAAVDSTRDGTGSTGDQQPLLPVERARASLEAIHAEFLDATDVLARHPSAEVFFEFDGHLTEKGNRVVADAMEAAWPLRCANDSAAH